MGLAVKRASNAAVALLFLSISNFYGLVENRLGLPDLVASERMKESARACNARIMPRGRA